MAWQELIVYANTDAGGEFELPLTRQLMKKMHLMKAEALINSSHNIEARDLLQLMPFETIWEPDLAAVSGTGLTLAQAKEELRRERRVALAIQRFVFL